MAHNIHARLSNISISAQKVRLVIDVVRGKPVNEALTSLKFMQQGAAREVHKVISSAVANAEENFGVSRDQLVIFSIMADEAPTRKWRRFGARGRFKPLLRRSSHISVVLHERE